MAKNSTVYYVSGAYKVTGRTFRARNRTFALNFEKTQLRRPVLIFALALAAAVYGFVYTFSDLIYPHELPWLVLPPIPTLLISSQIGMLLLRSRGLGQEGGAVIGWHRQLRKVRAAIDDALEDRADRMDREPRPDIREDTKVD